jgi:hypothetical protein
VPAGHQSRMRSPNGSDVTRVMIGCLPSLFCIREWYMPDRSRWGVISCQAKAVSCSDQDNGNMPTVADAPIIVHVMPNVRTTDMKRMAAYPRSASSFRHDQMRAESGVGRRGNSAGVFSGCASPCR